jgi:hypothetical protein
VDHDDGCPPSAGILRLTRGSQQPFRRAGSSAPGAVIRKAWSYAYVPGVQDDVLLGLVPARRGVGRQPVEQAGQAGQGIMGGPARGVRLHTSASVQLKTLGAATRKLI